MPSPLSHLTPRTTVAALAGAGVLLTGGIAAAATGLPDAASDTARQQVERTVPGPNEHAAGQTDERGSSAEHAADPSTGSDDGEHGKGAAVSETATTTESTGVDKGAEISTLASEGKSKAGQNDSAAESDGHAQVDTPNSDGADHPDNASGAAGGADQSRAPVDTTNSGGTGTADEATAAHDGASTQGTETADGASDGHSSSGSQNRP